MIRKINNKKSQITVFIIIGIILLILASLIYYFATMERDVVVDDIEQVGVEKIQFDSVDDLVESCIKSVGSDGLRLLGVQGGRLYSMERYLETYYSNISYAYYEGESVLVSLVDVKKQVDEFIELNVLECVDDFNVLKQQGIDVVANEISSNTLIKPGDVVFNLDYDLVIDGKAEAEKYKVSVPVDVYQVHKNALDIVNKIVADPDWIDITYLSEFKTPVSIIPHSDDSFVMSITDPGSVNGKDFVFLLGFKFEKNYAPNLQVPSLFELIDDVEFSHQVKAVDPEGDDFVFSDNHALFDISPNGLISFTPKVKGAFVVEITVTDSHGNSNSKEVKFVVK